MQRFASELSFIDEEFVEFAAASFQPFQMCIGRVRCVGRSPKSPISLLAEIHLAPNMRQVVAETDGHVHRTTASAGIDNWHPTVGTKAVAKPEGRPKPIEAKPRM